MSMKFTPAASTRTSACPSPGEGRGTSSGTITSGPPNVCTRIAFIGSSRGYYTAGTRPGGRVTDPASKPFAEGGNRETGSAADTHFDRTDPGAGGGTGRPDLDGPCAHKGAVPGRGVARQLHLSRRPRPAAFDPGSNRFLWVVRLSGCGVALRRGPASPRSSDPDCRKGCARRRGHRRYRFHPSFPARDASSTGPRLPVDLFAAAQAGPPPGGSADRLRGFRYSERLGCRVRTGSRGAAPGASVHRNGGFGRPVACPRAPSRRGGTGLFCHSDRRSGTVVGIPLLFRDPHHLRNQGGSVHEAKDEKESPGRLRRREPGA